MKDMVDNVQIWGWIDEYDCFVFRFKIFKTKSDLSTIIDTKNQTNSEFMK
jgi:hypothetical protein